MSKVLIGNVRGPQGDAAIIKIGAVNTGNAGTNASVVNVGTENEAKFDFTIPRGDRGESAFSRGSIFSASGYFEVDTAVQTIKTPASCSILMTGTEVKKVSISYTLNFQANSDAQMVVYDKGNSCFKLIGNYGDSNENYILIFAYSSGEIYHCDSATRKYIKLDSQTIGSSRSIPDTYRHTAGTWSTTNLSIDTASATMTITTPAIISDNTLISRSSSSFSSTYTLTFTKNQWAHVYYDDIKKTIALYTYSEAGTNAYDTSRYLLFTYYNGYLYNCDDHLKLNTEIDGVPYYEHIGLIAGEEESAISSGIIYSASGYFDVDTTAQTIKTPTSCSILKSGAETINVSKSYTLNFQTDSDAQILVYDTADSSFKLIGNVGNSNENYVLIFAYSSGEIYHCDSATRKYIRLNSQTIGSSRSIPGTYRHTAGTWSTTKLSINTASATMTITTPAIISDNTLFSRSSSGFSSAYTLTFTKSQWANVYYDDIKKTIALYNYNDREAHAYDTSKYLLFSYYSGYLYNCDDHLKLNTEIDGVPYYKRIGLIEDIPTFPDIVTPVYPDIVIPAVLDAVTGKIFNVYFDNMLSYPDYENTLCPTKEYPTRNEHGLRVLPDNTKIGTYQNTIKGMKKNGMAYGEKSFTFNVVSNSGGDGSTVKIMLLGDSLIDNKYLPTEYFSLLNTDGDYTFKQIGTRTNSNGTLHEGRSGWTWSNYVSSETLNNISNPFLNGGVLDFQNYLTAGSLNAPDIAFIELGTNDIKQGQALQTQDAIDAILVSAKQFVNAMLSGFPNTKIIICLPSIGGPFRSTNTRYMTIFRHNIQLLNRAYIDTFDNFAYSSRITCCGMGLYSYNPESYAYTTETLNRLSVTSREYSDAIHPIDVGYYQWADALYFKTRAILAAGL